MRFKIVVLAVLALCSLAGAQSNPPAWNPANSYSTGDVVLVNHNAYRAIASAKAGVDPTSNYNYWELANVRYSLTLKIGAGQTFPTLTTAWQYALNTTISQSALLQMDIITTGGNYSDNFTRPFSLDHPFGSRIAIGGDNPSKINFEFDSSDGLVIDGGHCLASLSGITLQHHHITQVHSAVFAATNATLPSITNMVFAGNWAICVESDSGAVTTLIGKSFFNANCRLDILTQTGSIYLPPNFTLDGRNSVNIGIDAQAGGRVYVGTGTSLTNFHVNALAAYFGSYIQADGCAFSGNATDVSATSASKVSLIGSPVSNTSVDSTSHLFLS